MDAPSLLFRAHGGHGFQAAWTCNADVHPVWRHLPRLAGGGRYAGPATGCSARAPWLTLCAGVMTSPCVVSELGCASARPPLGGGRCFRSRDGRPSGSHSRVHRRPVDCVCVCVCKGPPGIQVSGVPGNVPTWSSPLCPRRGTRPNGCPVRSRRALVSARPCADRMQKCRLHAPGDRDGTYAGCAHASRLALCCSRRCAGAVVPRVLSSRLFRAARPVAPRPPRNCSGAR